MIQLNFLAEWSSVVPWTLQDQVEQDLVISRALVEIYRDHFLRAKLAFRGGTALNKTHLSRPYRYSEDLDFIQITPEGIGDTLDALRAALDPWLGTPKRVMNDDLVKLQYRFSSAQGNQLKLKIEINSREHFLAESISYIPYAVRSQWFSDEALVTTLALPWLMGSKLRALYQRKKGRDLFDLVVVLNEGKTNAEEIVATFLKHLFHEGITISRAEFEENLSKKIENPIFISDLGPLVSPEYHFDITSAYKRVMNEIASLIPGESWKGLGDRAKDEKTESRQNTKAKGST